MMEKIPAAIHPDATVEKLRRGLSSRLFEIFEARCAHVAEGMERFGQVAGAGVEQRCTVSRASRGMPTQSSLGSL